MELSILSVGKISTKWIKEGIEEFEQRIKKYVKFNSVIIPDIRSAKSTPLSRIKEEEGKLILNETTSSDLKVLLDEKGIEMSSVEFAKWLEKQMATGKKKLVMVIGGPYGFSHDVYASADYKISLSKMTFTHEMAKLFLTEQIYRAMTILRNEPYHHE